MKISVKNISREMKSNIILDNINLVSIPLIEDHSLR